VRNAVLAAPAAFVIWQGREGNVDPSAVGWVGALSAVQVLGVFIAGLVVGLLAARWWNEAREMTGLPVGTPAPTFNLPDLEGERVTLDSLRSPDRPVLLLFTEPGCEYCRELLPEVGRWQDKLADELTIALISCDDPEENRAMSDEHGLSRVLLENDWEVSEVYQVTGTPSAVLVEPDGTIGSSLAESAEEIEALVSQAVKGSKERPEPR
jgi:methylamine dehydrogenase accessory protein MauD